MGGGQSVESAEERMMADMPIEHRPLQIGGELEFRPDGNKIHAKHIQHLGLSGQQNRYKEMINDARDLRAQEGEVLKPVCPSCARGDSIGKKCKICGKLQEESISNSPLKTVAGEKEHDLASSEAIVHLILDAEALKRRHMSHVNNDQTLYHQAQQRRRGRLSSKDPTEANAAVINSRARALEALKRVSLMRAKLYEDDDEDELALGPGVQLKAGSSLPEIRFMMKQNSPTAICVVWDSDAGAKATMAAICRSMNAGKPIAYNIEYRLALPGGGSADKKTSSLPWSRAAHHTQTLETTVENLINNTRYEFRGRRIGWGPWSSPVVLCTSPGPPSQPQYFQATELSATSVLLGWKSCEKDNGMPVVGFTLTVKRVGDAVAACRYQGTSKFFLVTDLEPNCVYTFELSARNAVGKGPSATLAVRTLQKGSKDITPWEADVDAETNTLVYRHQKTGTFSDHLPPGALLDDVASFRNKRRHLMNSLNERASQARSHAGLSDSAVVKLAVARGNIVSDSFHALMAAAPEELIAAPLRVNFANEEGVDAGGLAKDWFGAVTSSLLKGPSCLICADETELVHIDVRAKAIYDPAELSFWCEYLGVFLAKAVIDSQTIGIRLNPFLIALLCNRETSMVMLEESFPSYHQGLMWVQNNDVDDADLTFSVSEMVFDKPQFTDLVSGGNELAVSEDNKLQYIDLMQQWLARQRYQPMAEHCIRGFQRFLPANFLSWFSIKEIQLLLGGQVSIEVSDISKDVFCSGGFTATSPQVKWLWEVLSDWNLQQLSQFLSFCTGCAYLPIDGLRPPLQLTMMGLTNDHQSQQITDGTLPRTHTCFNQLVLPMYSSRTVLEDRLLFAMANTGQEFVMS